MTMLGLFEKRPDHPLANPREAERVLAALPVKRPAEALQELGHWLGTLAQFDGFACDDRLSVVKRLDGLGQPLAGAVFAEFYSHANHRDRMERTRFGLLQSYWENLAGAYRRCVVDNERGERRAKEIKEELPLALARSYRASFLAAKTRSMMYLSPGPESWLPLYRTIAFAELAHFDTTAVRIYEHEVRTTPRAELTKALALPLAAPHELPPAQVELAARILDRFAISFAWGTQPSAGCACAIDLANGGAPHLVGAREPRDGRRFFGAGPALPKLGELESLSARDLLSEEMRFGADFPPTMIVTVIRHLVRYLGPNPPRRGAPRVAMSGTLEVVRGFQSICQRVPAADARGSAALEEELKQEARKAADAGLQIEAEEVTQPPENWRVLERSEWGLGAELPPGLGNWTEPGILCGVRDGPGAAWHVAIIRRLDASEARATRCGMQVLSKKPVSVWLRLLGREGQQASNWESSTGSFSYDYLRAIVLSDAKADDRPVLLLESRKFVPDQICEVLIGERSRHIRLARFLEEGSDYLRAAFEWMAPGKS